MKIRDSIQSQGARWDLILGPSFLHILYMNLFRYETIENVALHKPEEHDPF